MKIKFLIILYHCILIHLPVESQTNHPPYLIKKGTTQQLVVEGKPFLILGGELGNSTASSLDYMRTAWAKFKAMNLNTILVPAYWELIEPEERRFDFALLDSILNTGRKNKLKVILLWFGSWKNSMSCYVSAWIKTNQSTKN